MGKVKFQQWECDVLRAAYANDNTALQLWDDGELIATATVNLDIKLPEDQAYIKDYSENEGMLEALEDAGVVTEVISIRLSGFVEIPLCRLDLNKIDGRVE